MSTTTDAATIAAVACPIHNAPTGQPCIYVQNPSGTAGDPSSVPSSASTVCGYRGDMADGVIQPGAEFRP